MINNFKDVNFTAVIGDTVYIPSTTSGGYVIRIMNEDGTPYDLSTATITGDCSGMDATVEFVDSMDGTFKAKFERGDTAGLGPGAYTYRLKLVDGGETFTVVYGRIRFDVA